ncbi:hypothetical protein RB595_003960 [Gaeumannomyces hyphopodioides]
MRQSVLAKVLLALAAGTGGPIQPALAHPGLKNLLREIQARAADGGAQGEGQLLLDSTALIGDLAITPEPALTPVGRSIRNMLVTPVGGEPAESADAYQEVDELPERTSAECKGDPCCAYRHVAAAMTEAFVGDGGQCNSLARQAIRLGFHDAAAWTSSLGPVGGADGSIVLAPEEMTRHDNKGMEEIVAQHKQWFDQFKADGIGMADLVQFGAAHATVTCPLGPRVRFFIGRKDSNKAAPDGLLPPVDASADFNIRLFQDKTIQPNGLAALIGAHTTSRQRLVDPSRAGDPQDSTPGTWDTLYYRQTVAAAAGQDVADIDSVASSSNSTNTQKRRDANATTVGYDRHGRKGGKGGEKVFVFPSDLKIAVDQRTADAFRGFAAGDGQRAWNAAYAREAVRLSLLGVGNINGMTECTRALPGAQGQEEFYRRR